MVPHDARRTDFPSDNFDFISSTATFEHIPATDIPDILSECYRLLKSNGIACFKIELEDHFSWIDKSINNHNYLKYPEWKWNMFFNSSIGHQNRLRANDYLKMFQQLQFKILEFNCDRPTDEDIKLLKEMKINKRFINSGILEDIGIKNLDVVLRKN